MSKWSIRVSEYGLTIRRPDGSIWGGVDTDQRHVCMTEAVRLCALALKRAAADADYQRAS